MNEVGYEYAPSFDGLAGALGDIAGLIEAAVPSLRKAPARGEPGTDTAGPADGEVETATGPESGPAAGVAGVAQAVQIESQKDAAAALRAAEDYFAACEPSTPALILVRQARLLIGKPLVAALEALAPQAAEQALIRFEGPPSFQIDIGRMRQLTAEAMPAGPGPEPEEASSRFTAASRADAAALIAGVETYFRRAEPSSPTPVLLAKARSFMNQDFLAIVKNLTAAEGQGGGG